MPHEKQVAIIKSLLTMKSQIQHDRKLLFGFSFFMITLLFASNIHTALSENRNT